MTTPLAFFRNLSLTWKIVSQMALLGLLSVVITLYLLASLRDQDRAYRTLLDTDAQVAVLVTTALNDLNDASRLVYAVLTEQEAERMRAALGLLDGYKANFHAKGERIRQLLPEQTAEFDQIHEQELQLFGLAAEIVTTAARWRGDKALAIIQGQFNPLLTKMRQQMEQMRDETVGHFQQASEVLTANTRTTLRRTILAISLVLMLVIGMAIWTSMTQIARPIKQFTGSMERLSQRDYRAPIAHTGQEDEIGKMAQTLEFFRSNLQRTDYLEMAKAEAERLAQAKVAFLATMSHEIRTPLNAIIGLARLSLRRPLPADQQERIDHIQKAGEHLLGVINNILDFSRLEGGHLEPESIVFSAAQLLRDVEVMLVTKAAENGLLLELQVPESMPLLLGDPLRIRQILLNLANNAIKFSHQGRILLSLELEEDADGFFLRGEVSDQGIGLTAKQIKGLFQPFAQVDASISRRFGGSGLGLAISQSLAELLGGEIGVQSQIGTGSRFWFRVAVAQAPLNAPPAEQMPVSTQALQGLGVLVVDDNELNRLVAVELLAEAGIKAAQAKDGAEAIRMLEEAEDGTYDLVLMDMMMPVLDGLATTRLLRRNPRFERLPIIAMTANTSQQDMEACLASGMNDLVSKPIDEQQLFKTLLRHCHVHKQHHGNSSPRPCSEKRLGKEVDEPCQQTADEAGLSVYLQKPLEGFDLPAAIKRLMNSRLLWLKLARGFVREYGDTVTRVRQLLAEGDKEAARRRVHSLKGIAASVGALRLQQLAHEVERQLEEGQGEALDELEGRLLQDLELLALLMEQLEHSG